MLNSNNVESHNPFLKDVAIIGMSCRFPGANNVDEFWKNITEGVESISRFSREELKAEGVPKELLDNPNYVPFKGILNNIESFDANFFGFNSHDAKLTDPQQKVFLEATWEALESAGYVPEKFSGTIGIYGCMLDSYYLQNNLMKNEQLMKSVDWLQLRVATTQATLTTQVSYRLNLTGPSVNVSTACSSSLVSVIQGCKDLQSYDSDIVIAGTVCITVPQKSGYLYQKDGIESPDGHCKTFDAEAKGTVFGNGLGIVILKRLEEAVKDNDTIYAVIKGGNINNDGADKLGFYAPSVNGQAKCVSSALAFTNIHPESIGYIEAWGTATQIGDPIEVEALTKAFQLKTSKKQFCAIGSVKTNIGHTDIAGGMAGVIKSVLALKNNVIPPTLHFKKANPYIDFVNSPFYVNTELKNWDNSTLPRRAGVNVSAIGGTNAFIILEEYIKPLQKQETMIENSDKPQIIILSAKTKTALDKITENLIPILEKTESHQNFSNIAFTLQVGRGDFNFRRAIIAKNSQEVLLALTDLSKGIIESHIKTNERPKIVFMFSGQGSQYSGMAKDLYSFEPDFARDINDCCAHLGTNIQSQVFSLITKSMTDGLESNNTLIVQPALFILEYCIAKWMISLGVIPDALIGHSLGEYVAAAIAGVITLTDALKIIQVRAKLMSHCETGMMLAVDLPVDELSNYISDHPISVAAINSPLSCVVSGKTPVMSKLEITFQQNNIPMKRLRVSTAFHSDLMDPILKDFSECMGRINLQNPKIPIISNLTGNWINHNEIVNSEYWVQHLRQTVKFSQGMNTLIKEEYKVFIEIGPGTTLCQFAKGAIRKNSGFHVQNTLPGLKESVSEQACILKILAKVWALGLKINWLSLHKYQNPQRVPLPTYPFERQKYWISPDEGMADLQSSPQNQFIDNFVSNFEHQPIIDTKYVAPANNVEKALQKIWQNILEIDNISVLDDFLELGGHSLTMLRLLPLIEAKFNVEISLKLLQELRTIRSFSEKLSEMLPTKRKKAHIINIRTTGKHLPLFCFHPVGGTVFPYVSLAQHLKYDCPIYGFQDPSLDNGYLFYESIEELATHYIKDIREVQNEGPYLLCGLSFGGTLAIEVARQLQGQGEQVKPIILFDSWAKFVENQFTETKFKENFSHYVSHLESSDTFIDLSWKRMSMLLDYKVHKLQNKIILFKAEDLLPEFASANQKTNYWDKYTKSLEVYPIPGNHETILQEPNVVKLADHLSAILLKVHNPSEYEHA